MVSNGGVEAEEVDFLSVCASDPEKKGAVYKLQERSCNSVRLRTNLTVDSLLRRPLTLRQFTCISEPSYLPRSIGTVLPLKRHCHRNRIGTEQDPPLSSVRTLDKAVINH